MKVSITLQSKDDGSISYITETDEPDNNHPMLEHVMTDIIAPRIRKAAEIDVPALITNSTENKLILAISVVMNVDNNQFLAMLGVKELPKNFSKTVIGKEVVATIAIEGGRVVVRGIKKEEKEERQ